MEKPLFNTVAHNCHGKIIFGTAKSISSRLNQFRSRQNQFYSWQIQFHHSKIFFTCGKINSTHGKINSTQGKINLTHGKIFFIRGKIFLTYVMMARKVLWESFQHGGAVFTRDRTRMFCSNCGTSVLTTARFCMQCGQGKPKFL